MGRSLRDHGLDGGRGPHNRGRVKGTARVEVCKTCNKCQGCCCEGNSTWDSSATSPGLPSNVSGLASCTPNSRDFNPPGDTFMVRFLGSSAGGRDFGNHAGGSIPLAPYLKKCTHWNIGGTSVDMSCQHLDFGNPITNVQPPPYDSSRAGCTRNVGSVSGWGGHQDSGLLFSDETLCEKIHDRISALGGYDGVPFAWGPLNYQGDRLADPTNSLTRDFHVPGNCEWTFASTGYSLLGIEMEPGDCGGEGLTARRGSGIIASGLSSPGAASIPLTIGPPQSHYAYSLPGGGIKDGWQATGYLQVDGLGMLVIDSNGDPVGSFYGGSGYLSPPTVVLSGVSLGTSGYYPEFHIICIGPDIGFGPGRWGNGHHSYPRVQQLGGHAPGWEPTHCSVGPYFYGTGHTSGTTQVLGARDWMKFNLTRECCPEVGPSGEYNEDAFCLDAPVFPAAEGNSFIAGFGGGTVIGYSNTQGEDKPGTSLPWKGYSDHTESGPLRALGAAAVGGSEPPSHRMRYDFRPRDASLNENQPIANNQRKGLPSSATETLSAGSCGSEKMITVGGAGGEYPPSHVTPNAKGGRWCPDGNGQPWSYVTDKNPIDGWKSLGEGDCCPIINSGQPGTWDVNGTSTGGVYSCCGYSPSISSTTAKATCTGNGGVWYSNKSFGNYAPPCCDDVDRYTDVTCANQGWSGCRASLTNDELGLFSSPPYYPSTGNSAPGGTALLNCTGCENCLDGAGKPECIAWTGELGAPGMEVAYTGYWTAASWACGGGVSSDCPSGEYGESGPGSGDGRGECCQDPRDNCTRYTARGNPANCGDFANGCAPDPGVKVWGYATAFNGCTAGNYVDGEWGGVYPSAVPCPGGISDLSVRGLGTPRLLLQCHHSHGGKSESELTKQFNEWSLAGMSESAEASYRSKLKDLSRKFPEWMQVSSPSSSTSGAHHFVDHSGTIRATSGSLADGGRRSISYGGGTAYLEDEYVDGYWVGGGRAGCRDMNPTGNDHPHKWHPQGIVDGIHVDQYNDYLISGGPSYSDSGHLAQYYPFANTSTILTGREKGDEASEGVGDYLDRSGQMSWPRPSDAISHWGDGSSLGSGVYYDHFPYGSDGVYSHLDSGDPKTGCRVRAYLVYDFFEDSQFSDKENDLTIPDPNGPQYGELQRAGHGATGYCTMKVTSFQLQTKTMDYGPKTSAVAPVKENFVAGGSGFFEVPTVNFVAQSGYGNYCGTDMPSGAITGNDANGNPQSSSWAWGDGAYASDYFKQPYYSPEGSGASGHVEMKLFDLHLTATGSGYNHIPKIIIEPPTAAGSRGSSKRECFTPPGAIGASAYIRTMSGTIVGFEVIDEGYGFYLGNSNGDAWASGGALPNLWNNGESPITSTHNGAVTTGTPVLGVVDVYMCSGGCGYTEDFDVDFGPTVTAEGLARVECGSVVKVDIIEAGDDGSIDSLPQADFSAGAGSGASGLAVVGLKRIMMDQGIAPVGSYAYHDFNEDSIGGCKMGSLGGQGGVFVDGPGDSTELLSCCGTTTPVGAGYSAKCDSLLGRLQDPSIKAIFGNGSITQSDGSGVIISEHGYGYTHIPRVTIEEQVSCASGTTSVTEMLAEMTITKVVLDSPGSGYILPPEAFFECDGKWGVDPSKTTSSDPTAIGRCWPSGFSTGLFTFRRDIVDEEGGSLVCSEARWAKQHNSQCPVYSMLVLETTESGGEVVLRNQTCCHPNGVYLSNVYLGVDKVYVTYGGDSYDEFGRAISYSQPSSTRNELDPHFPYIRFSKIRALKCGPGVSCGQGSHTFSAGRLSSEPRPFYYDEDPGSMLNTACEARARIVGLAGGQLPLGTTGIVIDDAGDYFTSAPEIHFVGLNGWRSTKCSNLWFHSPPGCNDIPTYGTKGQLLYPTGLEHTEMGTWQSVSAPHPSGQYAWPMGVDYYWGKYTDLNGNITKTSPYTAGKLCSIGPDMDSYNNNTSFPGEGNLRKWMEINVPLSTTSFSRNTNDTKYGLSAVWVCDDFNCEADGNTKNTFYLASGFYGEGACCTLPYGVEVWNPNCACEIKGAGASGHGILTGVASLTSAIQSSPVLSSEDWGFLANFVGENSTEKTKKVEYVTRAQKRESRPESPTPLTNNRGIIRVEIEKEEPKDQAPSIDNIVPKQERGRVVNSKEEDIERRQKEAWQKNSEVRGGLVKQTKRYVNARQKWSQNGKPVRSQERINEVFKICQACPNFTGNACSLCGCRITMQGNFMNKLAWATESCPDNPPRWEAEVDV